MLGVKRESDAKGVAAEYHPFQTSPAKSAGSPSQGSRSLSRSRKRLEADQRANATKSLQHQRVFLRRQSSLKGVIFNAKKELATVKKIASLPQVVQSVDDDYTILEDRKYL